MNAGGNDGDERVRQIAFRLIILLGIVSLLGDFVSNGARSVTGPYLELLGASAAVVGLVAGLGEFIGYGLRILTGVYANQSRHYWTLVLLGYGLLIAIPLLALAGRWEIAAFLIIFERIGKAIRTPARDTILSHATSSVGRGWGFGIHKALDQFGAIIGPLTLSAVLMMTGGYQSGFLILGIPLIFMVTTIFAARAAVPRPRRLELPPSDQLRGTEVPNLQGLIPYAVFIFLSMVGFASFPLISFHMIAWDIVPDAEVPVFYAAAMAISVVTALATGKLYDRAGISSMIIMPVINITIPFFAFSLQAGDVLVGTLVWGVGIGMYETVLRAAIADFTGADLRGQTYGVLNAIFGTAWFIGSVVMGVLYEVSIDHIIGYVLIVELAAAGAFYWMIREYARNSRAHGG